MTRVSKRQKTLSRPQENTSVGLQSNGKTDNASRDGKSLLGTIANIASTSAPVGVVWRFYLQSLSRRLLPDERVAECLRSVRPGKAGIEIMHTPGAKSGHYKNLIVCARIWICPVCASKITEQRRRELTLAVEQSGYAPLLITFTLRHHADDDLKSMVHAITMAFRGFKSGRKYQQLRNSIEWIGDVRSLEVTYGDNGWHPHIHVLTLVKRALNAESVIALENSLRGRWRATLRGLGRDADWQHGVDVRTADKQVADYIAKYGRLPKATGWTVEHELTKSPVKKGKHEGRSPMQLLADYGAGDEGAGTLFQEYAEAFYGRHQLQWSPGLRDKLGLNDDAKTDEELANENISSATILATLGRGQWRVVLGNDIRAELLAIAGLGDAVALREFLGKVGVTLPE